MYLLYLDGWLFIAMLVFAGVNIVFRVEGEGLTFLIAICFVSTYHRFCFTNPDTQCMVYCLHLFYLHLMSFNHKNQPNIGRYTIHGSWISRTGSWKNLKKSRPFRGKKSKSINPEDLFGKPVLFFLGKMWNVKQTFANTGCFTEADECSLHVLYFISLNFSYYMWHHSKWCSKIKKTWDKLLPKVSWRE